jgi:molecular chaperone DnaK
MVKDAEAHAADDKRQRALAEARNTGDNAAYQAEKQLAELGDKVDADSRQRIETSVKELREALESEDVEQIQSRTEAVQQAFHAVSEAMYQQAAQSADGAADGAAADGAGDQEEVVDAEVVDEGKS